MPDAAYEAAAAAANDLLVEDVPDEAPETGEQPEADTADTETVQHDEPPELPEELREELELPDFEAEAEAEIEAETTEEWESDETKELRKQLRAAEKRTAFLEGQTLKRELPRWKAEAEKYFPYADSDGITATSRRAFLKAAKTQHELIAPKVAAAVAAKTEGFDPEVERERIRAEVKAEAAVQWGVSTSGGGLPPAEAKENADKVDTAIQTGGLSAGILEMLKQRPVREGGERNE